VASHDRREERVLLANIYGVDIDSQAVETTKLSLLLKVLEGETVESISSQLTFLHERALPDLAANIKCGNSLIGPDFYDDQQLGLLLGADEATASTSSIGRPSFQRSWAMRAGCAARVRCSDWQSALHPDPEPARVCAT